MRRDDPRTLAFYEDEAERYALETLPLDVGGRLPDFVHGLALNAPVLDVGCGAGRDLAAFRRRGVWCIGVDRSLPLACIARRKSARPVTIADFRALPFAHSSFAGIWASASLLHLHRSELAATLGGLASILMRRGRLYVSLKRGAGTMRQLDGRLFSLYREAELCSAAEAAGLRILDVREDGRAGCLVPAGSVDEWIDMMACKP